VEWLCGLHRTSAIYKAQIPVRSLEMLTVSLLLPTRKLSTIEPAVWEPLTASKSLRQIVVVVDAKEDAVERKAFDALSRNHSQWRWNLLFTNESPGFASALNLGIEQVSEPLTARQDDDDVSSTDRIDLQSAEFDRDPTLILLGGHLRYLRGNRFQIRRYPTAFKEVLGTLPYENPFAHPTVMIRTDILRELRYSTMQWYCSDYDLWIRARSRGVMRNLDRALATYRIKTKEELSRFEHGAVFRAHAKLKWNHRRILLAQGKAHRFYALILAEYLFSATPRFFYRWFYARFLYP